MKSLSNDIPGERVSRSPCGERGLKCQAAARQLRHIRRSPCGERGLKFHKAHDSALTGLRRSPCGERGLKSAVDDNQFAAALVAPRAGSVD